MVLVRGAETHFPHGEVTGRDIHCEARESETPGPVPDSLIPELPSTCRTPGQSRTPGLPSKNSSRL
eukprot:1148283-Amorphochlora_amoeboformis.AAC.2